MPITPRYHLSQTHSHVSIHVAIPHVRVSHKTLELIVEGTEVNLYAPPTYLLKLTLPAEVVDEYLHERSLDKGGIIESASPGLVQDITAGTMSTVAAHDSAANDSTNTINQWSEEDLPRLQYDPLQNHGTIVITLRKVTDEFWPDLDLLGRLQQPLLHQKKSLIVREEYAPNSSDVDIAIKEEGVMDGLKSIHRGTLCYGLFRNYHNVFTDYAREGLADEMLECPNPDQLSETYEEGEEDSDSRREMRLAMENDKFNSDRYLGDANLGEGDDIIFDVAMGIKPHWMTVETTSEHPLHADEGLSSTQFFTEEESHILATLKSSTIPNLTADQIQSILLTISDILFAYAYDHRTTDGECTVESSWTIMILSPTFSWLENYTAPYVSIADVMRWCVRRSLIYPYLRNYDLAIKIVRDVAMIFMQGRRVILRCLLRVHSIMEKSEAHYLFDKLYVDPSIWWVQSVDENVFRAFGKEFFEVLSLYSSVDSEDWSNDKSNMLSKKSLDLGLMQLEQLETEDGREEKSKKSDESSWSSHTSSSTSDGYDSGDNTEKKMVQLMQTLDIQNP